jgi:hypothetical protein
MAPLASILRSRTVSLLMVFLAVSGCSVDHSMEPRPAGPACPTQSAAQGSADGVIAWYGPSQGRDQAKLADWCRTVGPSVIDSVPASEYGDWGAGDALAIVTWNVNVGGGDLDLFLREELDLECEGGLPIRGQRFSHFALLLQEARRLSDAVPVVPDDRSVPPRIEPDPWPGEHNDITDVARNCGLALFYVASQSRRGQPSIVESSPQRVLDVLLDPHLG